MQNKFIFVFFLFASDVSVAQWTSSWNDKDARRSVKESFEKTGNALYCKRLMNVSQEALGTAITQAFNNDLAEIMGKEKKFKITQLLSLDQNSVNPTICASVTRTDL